MKTKRYIRLALILAVASACAKQEPVTVSDYGQKLELTFDMSISDLNGTKTSCDAVNHLGLWKREDMAGVTAGYDGTSFTDSLMQEFRIANRNQKGAEFLSTATFSGKLTDKGSQTYTYYAVYPYTAFQNVTNISSFASRLEERQYPDLKSWDGDCDMLAAKPVTVSSTSVAAENLQIQFARLFGILRLRFGSSIIDAYGSEMVETISIVSTDAEDKFAGKFTIDLSSTEAPAPVMSTESGETYNKIILDYRGKNATLSEIDAYFVLNSGSYPDVTVTVSTKDHILTMPRKNLHISRGNVTSAVLNWKSNDIAAVSSSLLPRNPATLKILTFGHSFVQDSMEYIDELLNDAGVTQATFANLMIGSASLYTYWGFASSSGNVKGGTTMTVNYNKRYFDGATVTTAVSNKTIIDAVCDEPWDVVVLQDCPENEGKYDLYAPYLIKMMDYIKTTCQKEHGKAPVFAWHMFWIQGSHSSYLTDNYCGSQILGYEAYLQSAKKVMRNHDIQLIIPTGTAIQSLRYSRVNNPYNGDGVYEFARDGLGVSHLDKKAGRYTAACTWFEYFIKPCFGKTVLGDTFTPATDAGPGVNVTDDNRDYIQRAAILACQSPFEISHLDSTLDMPESTEDFTLSDNIIW